MINKEGMRLIRQERKELQKGIPNWLADRLDSATALVIKN